ncbi:DUF2811 domain-containing protein [Prochlorococcus sp. MIT 1223]|uniref:DUF2811 domain-containing protein n=1 Tax=Prochlorococcus sp. MIT 1223 TaxID=3096217 RepID=UPI002A758A3C|nr:DUF2811 domain-containing protein [Prochlorococcus sp. MIT 1223]
MNYFEASSSETSSHKLSLEANREYMSLETEIPESLYNGMNDFIESHPNYDQCGLMSSALANFLYQNGCSDRAVTEKYLNDLFAQSSS